MAASPNYSVIDEPEDTITSLAQRETHSEQRPRPHRLTFVIRLPAGAEISWLDGVSRQLGRILALEEGWDSYGGRRIKHESIRGVVQLLDRLGADVRAPAVYPASDGSVVLEWTTVAGALEIKVEGNERVSFYAEDLVGGSEIEKGEISQTTFLMDFLPKIAHLVPRV